MKILLRSLLLALVSLFMTLGVAAASVHDGERKERVSVRVAAESVVRSESLTLGDIAQIQPGDSPIGERLRLVALGYSPNVGAIRELARERIMLAIAAARLSDGAVIIEAPAIAIVRRAAQAVEPALVREAIERVALASLRATGATAQLIRLDLPNLLEVPSGAVEARASLGGARDLFAPFMVSVEILVDGRVMKRFSATAQIEAYAAVIVAARDLAAGERVRERDVSIEIRRLEGSVTLYVREMEKLRGASARRAVARGEALAMEALTAEIVVRVGDAVRITCESNALVLAVGGEARATGRVGDRIQVKNLQSGALLQAVVMDEGLVRVRF